MPKSLKRPKSVDPSLSPPRPKVPSPEPCARRVGKSPGLVLSPKTSISTLPKRFWTGLAGLDQIQDFPVSAKAGSIDPDPFSTPRSGFEHFRPDFKLFRRFGISGCWLELVRDPKIRLDQGLVTFSVQNPIGEIPDAGWNWFETPKSTSTRVWSHFPDKSLLG